MRHVNKEGCVFSAEGTANAKTHNRKIQEAGEAGNTVKEQVDAGKEMRGPLWAERVCPLKIHVQKS